MDTNYVERWAKEQGFGGAKKIFPYKGYNIYIPDPYPKGATGYPVYFIVKNGKIRYANDEESLALLKIENEMFPEEDDFPDEHEPVFNAGKKLLDKME